MQDIMLKKIEFLFLKYQLNEVIILRMARAERVSIAPLAAITVCWNQIIEMKL